MKKHRRVSLSIAILVPTILAFVLSLGGIYAGAYFVLQDTASQIAMDDDTKDLATVNSIYSDGDYGILGYSLTPVVDAYEENKPAAPFTPGSPEELAYRAIIASAASSYLASSTSRVLERYATSFMGIFYEDTAASRMVLVCSSNTKLDPSEETSLYLGSFFSRNEWFDGDSFYGKTVDDSTLGRMFTSGIFLCEVAHPTQGGPTHRYWLIRETSEAMVYSITPSFTRLFAIVASVTLVVLSVIAFLLLFFLIIRPTKRLSASAGAYVASVQSGVLESKFELSRKRTRNELSELNDAFYFAQEAIAVYSEEIRSSTAYKERVNAELALAERIQASMVPSDPLYGHNFEIRGHMQPAKEVGGDLYNYFRVDEDHVAFFIGDVSGKGVPAALFMAKTSAALRLGLKDLDIDNVNNFLCQNNVENFFVTAFLALLNVKTGEMRYVNCGHEPVFYYHNGVYSALPEKPNFMLGCLDDFNYAVETIRLKPGDRLFLYTDGISEAMNEAGELYGKERILSCLNAHGGLPSGEIFRAIAENVHLFVGNAEQSDDECMVAMDYAREKELTFSADREGLATVPPFVDDFLEGKDKKLISELQIVLDELCSNAVFYSGSGDKPITLILRDDKDAIHCTLIDQGTPFNPLTDKPEKKDKDQPGGLGIIMTLALTDDISYERLDDRNVLSLVKKIKS